MIAIDLGSNSLRVLAFDCKTKKEIFATTQVVKTADNLVHTGVIAKETINRIVKTLNSIKKEFDFKEHKIRAVTTEALRRAKNSNEVLQKIKEATDIEFEIISGEEEALLTLEAVKFRLEKLNIENEKFALIDIGGGSTEIIFKNRENIVTQSFPIGIVTVTQSYNSYNEIKEALIKDMKQIEEFAKKISNFEDFIFVGTAGTPTTLASLKLGLTYNTYSAKKINGTILEKKDLDIYFKKLLNMSEENRVYNVGTGRSDLVSTGILIFQRLYEILNIKNSIVVDDGLREGVAINECSK